jgi:hypothetical protein
VSSTSFVASVLSPEFYKFGYVTNDRDRAVEVLKKDLGVEEFATFSPSMEVTDGNGETGTATLNCAFSAGRKLFIEVMQPVSGLVQIFQDSLTPSTDFQLVFHHISVIVEDLDAVKTAAAELGIKPALEAHLAGGMHFTYMKLPGLGHWIEHDQYDGDSQAFLNSVAARPIA